MELMGLKEGKVIADIGAGCTVITISKGDSVFFGGKDDYTLLILTIGLNLAALQGMELSGLAHRIILNKG